MHAGTAEAGHATALDCTQAGRFAATYTPLHGPASTFMSLLLAHQVQQKHCLVIGAGEVALSRVHHMIRANAKITVVAGSRDAHPEILQLSNENKIHNLILRDYQSNDLQLYEEPPARFEVENIGADDYKRIVEDANKRFAVVCCCIDDYELSTKIYYQCKYLHLPVNIADKPPMCDFYFGSMFNQDSLQIMISTNGKSPRLLRLIKDDIARTFKDVDLNKAVDNLGAVRAKLRSSVIIDDDLVSIDTRMNWIKSLTDFFTLREWSLLDIDEESAGKLVSYFPDFPPRDYNIFSQIAGKPSK